MTLETATKRRPPQIDISVQDPVWETMGDVKNIINITAQTTLVNAIIPKAAMGRDFEVSIVLANNDLVQVLNREYRNQDKPTNVLTFASLDGDDPPPPEGVLNLGDVILAYQTIERESFEQGKFLLDHVKHLTVHGVLHLLGYDHQTDDEATDMETLEIRILEKLGVQNPYTETDYGL
ncbi:MAG TPA: rRNA maturation RNase YbeY [Alphaproteobacteria bacterium]|nr:rRNA maturation RNase YbeY [Alphaproteobacteria bacterium]